MISETRARNAKPKDKKYTISDIRGLNLEVSPTGRKYWRFRYTRDGKRSWYTIGEYPIISLDEAREKIVILRDRVKKGMPLELKAEKDNRFASVVTEWLEEHKAVITPRNYEQHQRILRLHIFPMIGDMDIRQITPLDVLAVIKSQTEKGHYQTAHMCKSYISQTFRYAALHGFPVTDPCSVLRGAINRPQQQHYPSPKNPVEIGKLLNAIDGYANRPLRLAMLFSIYTFCRPGEMRNLEWKDLYLENAEWRVPAEKMKMKRAHIVPLSEQVLKIIEAARSISGHKNHVFTSTFATVRDRDEPMGHTALISALRVMGYTNKEITPHGFRSMASTLLNENGHHPDWIERQLAHIEGNRVRAAYNYADYLPERRKMMQWYANYLDELRGGPMNLD